MNIVVPKDQLLEGLQRVFNIVPQKPTLPILSNYLISCVPGAITVSGTDMDLSVSTTVPCNVDEEGAFTVNAKRFVNIIRELPDGDVTIDVDGERITIYYAGGQSRIMGMPSNDFPDVQHKIDGVSVNISGEMFQAMVEKTRFAAATDRTRLALTGVYWKVAPGMMEMVATDGHRLAFFERSLDIGITEPVEMIVPPKALEHAVRIFSGGLEIQAVVFGEKAVLFDFGTASIFSKVIEGPYPNFTQVIPENNSKLIVLPTQEFEAGVRRVSVLSNAITHQIRMNISAGSVELTTTNADIGGEAHQNLEIEYDGEPLVVGYNSNFFLEILRKIDTDQVLLELESPTTACIAKPVGMGDEERLLYLIMPLRLNE